MLVCLPEQWLLCIVLEQNYVYACVQNHKMVSYATDSNCSMSRANHGFSEQLASFPGPAQLSVASSTVKRERAWYLFSRE